MTFNIIPAKPTFGNLKQTMDSSEYLQKKNTRIYSCVHNIKCNKCCNYSLYNKHDLNANLISRQNLLYICSLLNNNNNICNTRISLSNNIPFYELYKIDPRGELYGNNQCGVNNYVRYMDFNKIKYK